jgi:ribonucleoside-diphosphate reductase alpha chain
MLKLSWDKPEAADLNQRIFEHMYYAAVLESTIIASTDGAYKSYEGSPASKGKLQFDMWKDMNGEPITPLTMQDKTLDWPQLYDAVKEHGLRNSLLMAPMPTASTSQILGYNECFEPFNSNLYTRRTLAGEFIVVNKYLLNELMELNLWDENLKQQLIINNGSVQNITAIPEEIRDRYKTVYEMSQKTLIDMAAARGAFICQSQSLNLFVAEANYAKLTSMHFYAWKKGLKTGCYYLRTKAPVMAQKFTVDPRLMAGSNAPVYSQDDDSDSYNSSDEEPELTPEQQKRALLKEKLAKEYEEELAKGCVSCSG